RGGGSNSSVAFHEPPRASVLSVPLGVTSPPDYCTYPYIAAADSSGLLLLRATLPSMIIIYHICDARTGEVFTLGSHWRPMGSHGINVGLITRGNDGCVVAELQLEGDGTGRATLLTYKVEDQCRWVERELTYSPPLLRRFWAGEGVVSYAGMLWWVDLSYGALACDPFVDDPELIHVPFPAALDDLPAAQINRGARRCLKVSGGRLRCVQIHGSSDASVVSMWALADPPMAGKWNSERSVPFAEVWANESYLDTMLPGTIPALALLHPTDPDRVYFFLDSCIFAVDLRLKKIVEFSCQFTMPKPTYCHLIMSSHLVHAWQYDPSSTRSDLLSTCLRQDNIAAQSSFFSRPISRKTAIELDRFRELASSVHREQQKAVWKEAKSSRVVKRRIR
ncbi:hypothetical protein EJB05_19209, partial [Eragrostis curvula]